MGKHDSMLSAAMRSLYSDSWDGRLASLLGEAALKKRSASSLMSLETRREILKLCEGENAALKARFMAGEPDGPLFSLPMPKDVLERSEMDRMSEDIAMLTRAVFALSSRFEGTQG